jgi:GTPase Era involved in 16S rRNA processing
MGGGPSKEEIMIDSLQQQLENAKIQQETAQRFSEEQLQMMQEKSREDADRQAALMNTMQEQHRDALDRYHRQTDEANARMATLMEELAANRVTDEEYRRQMAEIDRQKGELENQLKEGIQQLNLAKEEKAILQKVVDNDIREAHKKQFPMSPELAQMKKKYPGAIFIQVLGSSGTGKSTLMNTLVAGTDKVDEDDFVEIFKSDVVECTVKTQFHEVTEQFKKKMDNNQFAWLQKEKGGNFPRIFLVDQPGIGGKQVSAQGYMAKFTPGHYDLTLAATSTRLMENEYFLMMHLQKFERPYIIVRTKVDADVNSNISGAARASEEKFNKAIQRVKDEFLKTEVKDLNSKSIHCTGKPIYVPKERKEITFDENYKNIEEALMQGIMDAINKNEVKNLV